jgi:hypothetical protein
MDNLHYKNQKVLVLRRRNNEVEVDGIIVIGTIINLECKDLNHISNHNINHNINKTKTRGDIKVNMAKTREEDIKTRVRLE